MLATYLKFSPFSSFKTIQIVVIFPKNAISVNYFVLEFFECMGVGGSHIHNIPNGFNHVTFKSTSKMEILMEGAEIVIPH